MPTSPARTAPIAVALPQSLSQPPSDCVERPDVHRALVRGDPEGERDHRDDHREARRRRRAAEDRPRAESLERPAGHRRPARREQDQHDPLGDQAPDQDQALAEA